MNVSTIPARANAPSSITTATYSGLFPSDWNSLVYAGTKQDKTGPFAYLADLYRSVVQLEDSAQKGLARLLKERRPDLSALMLDANALDLEVPTLDLLIELLEDRMKTCLPVGASLKDTIANATAPRQLPFHGAWQTVRAILAARAVPMWQAVRKSDRAFPSFIVTHASSQAMRNAITLGSGLSLGARNLLTAANANDASAVAFFTKTPGVTAADLAKVTTLTEVTRLSRRDIRHILAVRGLATSASDTTAVTRSASATTGVESPSSKVFGARFINGGNTKPLELRKRDGASTDTDTEIVDLTPGHLDRLHRLLELRHRLDLSFEDTDLLLCAALCAESGNATGLPTENSLRAFGMFGHLAENRRISVPQFTALIDRVCPYGIANKPAFYDDVFGPQATGSTGIALDGGALDSAGITQLSTALRVSEGELNRILAWIRTAQKLGDTAPRTLPVLSACYRLTALPRLCGLAVAEGLALVELLEHQEPGFLAQLAGQPSLGGDGKKLDVIDAVSAFWNAAEWAREVGLSYVALRGVILPSSTPTVPQSSWVTALKRAADTLKNQGVDATVLANTRAGVKLAKSSTDEKVFAALETLIDTTGIVVFPHAADGGPALRTALSEALKPQAEVLSWARYGEDWVAALAAKLQTVAIAQEDAAYAALNKGIANLEPEVWKQLSRWAGIDPLAFVRDAVTAAEATAETSWDKRFTTDMLSRWHVLSALASLAGTMRLSAAAMVAMAAHPERFDLSGPDQPPALIKLDLRTMYRLACYVQWIDRLPSNLGEEDALAYLKDTGNGRLLKQEAADRLAALMRWQPGDVTALTAIIDDRTGIARNMTDIAWLMRMQDLQRQLSLTSEQLLALNGLKDVAATDRVDTVASALLGTMSTKEREAVDARSRERWRDALCSWLLHHWAGGDALLGDIRDPDALSAYLLTDVQVGSEPRTTRTAFAIASLQQYIHRLYARLEPGYQWIPRHESDREQWTAWRSQYSQWRLHQRMLAHPEDYLDPTRRTRKTKAFADFEKLIAQGKFSDDDVQIALLGYLSSFERTSNIMPLTAYEDGEDPQSDTFHFIGRSNVEPAEYYWRTLDMSMRSPDGAVSMLAWSEWEKITLPMTGIMVKTPVGPARAKPVEKKTESVETKKSEDPREYMDAIRPVVIAGRRYTVWLERDPSATQIGGKASDYFVFRLCYSYLQTDGLWSPANELIRLDGQSERGTPGSVLGKPNTEWMKGADYMPRLAVMVNSKGYRAKDPWLVAMLFEPDVDSLNKTLPNIEYPTANKNYYLAVRDLLLISDQRLNVAGSASSPGIEQRLARNWAKLFDDPRVVQHHYFGPVFDIKQKEDGKSTPNFTLHRAIGNASPGITDSETPPEHVTTVTARPSLDVSLSADRRSFIVTCRYDMHSMISSVPVDRTGGILVLTDLGFFGNESDENLKRLKNNFKAIGDELAARLGDGAKPTGRSTPPGNDAQLVVKRDPKSKSQSVVLKANREAHGELHSRSVMTGINPIFLVSVGSDREVFKISNRHEADAIGYIMVSEQGQLRFWKVDFEGFAEVKSQPFATEAILTVNGKQESVGDPPSTDIRTLRFDANEPKNSVEWSITINKDVLDYSITVDLREPGGKGTTNGPWGTLAANITIEQMSDGTMDVVDDVPSVRLGCTRDLVHYVEFPGKTSTDSSVRYRLNTLFGKQLVALATQSTDLAVGDSAQSLTEPSLSGDGAEKLDLGGANGLYFWEIFFHAPWLIAWRLRETREFSAATRWCSRFLFDPYSSRRELKSDTPFWKSSPLRITTANAVLDESSTEPDMIAHSDPLVWKRAVFIFLVELWLMEGDDAYRRMERDTRVHAWFCYEKALRLIGTLPEPLASEQWTPARLDAIDETVFLDAPDRTIAEIHARLLRRMFNLRHGLTIDGKAAPLPMYARESIHPGVPSTRSTVDSSDTQREPLRSSHYRFADLLPRARAAVERLSDMGRHLFKVYESEYDAGLGVMLQDHLIQIHDYAIRLQRNAVESARAEYGKLVAGRRLVELKRNRYQALIEAGISPGEQTAFELAAKAHILENVSLPYHMVSGSLKLITNIYGMAFGGSKFEGIPAAIGKTIEGTAKFLKFASEQNLIDAGYERRESEWKYELACADAELAVSKREMQVQQLAIDASSLQLDEHIAHLALMREEYVFMTTGFAIGPTYQWMIENLSYIYSATYDAVKALCLEAEAAYQHETGDYGSFYVKPDAWLDGWRGMLAGESLQRDLLAMEEAYLHRNERRLEIQRDISLSALRSNGVGGLRADLDASDAIDFRLDQALFDADFPGHFQRRIRHLSLSFVLDTDGGTHDGISAMLTQLSSSIMRTADLDAVDHLHAGNPTDHPALVVNVRPLQKAAISHCLPRDDIAARNSVLHHLTFNDGRLLAFEATGAVSSWQLRFPGNRAHWQKVLKPDGTWRLRDIVVHLSYTAVGGDDNFSQGVKNRVSKLPHYGVSAYPASLAPDTPSAPLNPPSSAMGKPADGKNAENGRSFPSRPLPAANPMEKTSEDRGPEDRNDANETTETTRTATTNFDNTLERLILWLYGQSERAKGALSSWDDEPDATSPEHPNESTESITAYDYVLADDAEPMPSACRLSGFSGPFDVTVTGNAPYYHVRAAVKAWYTGYPDGRYLPRGTIEPLRTFTDEFDLDTSVPGRWKITSHIRTADPEVQAEWKRVEHPPSARRV